jgi:hypothetical protein
MLPMTVLPLSPKGQRQPGEAAAVMLRTMADPRGTTEAAMATALGWVECHVACREAAASAGLRFEKLKIPGEPIRFRTRPADTPNTSEWTTCPWAAKMFMKRWGRSNDPKPIE